MDMFHQYIQYTVKHGYVYCKGWICFTSIYNITVKDGYVSPVKTILL